MHMMCVLQLKGLSEIISIKHVLNRSTLLELSKNIDDVTSITQSKSTCFDLGTDLDPPRANVLCASANTILALSPN